MESITLKNLLLIRVLTNLAPNKGIKDDICHGNSTNLSQKPNYLVIL